MQRTVIVRGGGDLATGILYRLHHVGYRVVSLETERPMVVRRTVSAAQAVFEGSAQVEDIEFQLLETGKFSSAEAAVPVWIDPEGKSIGQLNPDFVIDAIMAKKNIGTCKTMAPRVIGIGPGFTAGQDVHYVVETMRGHYLGRVISEGSATPDTGVPGEIAGESRNRLLKSPGKGYLKNFKEIGDTVEAGEKVGEVAGIAVKTAIRGVLRGLIHPSVPVSEGMKIGDVDPRNEKSNCFTISDKALSVAGGVLEAMLRSR